MNDSDDGIVLESAEHPIDVTRVAIPREAMPQLQALAERLGV